MASSESDVLKQPTFKRRLLDTAIVGFFAGCIEGVTTFPSEFVKTQLQLDDEHARRTGEPKKFTGSWNCFKQTINHEGNFTPLRVYRGLSPMLFCAIPKISVRFSAYELGANWIAPQKRSDTLTTKEALGAGFIAGSFEAFFVVTAQETIKVKFIHDINRPNPRYKGLFNGISQIYSELGFKGVYAGLTATMIKESANCTMRFAIVMGLKDNYRKTHGGQEAPLYLTAAYACLAGMVSVTANMPVDVIKTRMQGLEAARYSGFLDCGRCIYKDDGWRGYYRGLFPRMTRVVIELVVCFTVFDWLKPKVSAQTTQLCDSLGWD